MYFIFESGGKQYKASPGQRVRVEKLPIEEGKQFSFDRLVMKADDDKVDFGSPYLKGEVLEARVVQHGRGDKIPVIKFKRRKHYLKRLNHRQAYTEVEILRLATAEPEKEPQENTKPQTQKAKETKETKETKAESPATNEAEAIKEAKETKATEETEAESPATNEAEATKEAKETKATEEAKAESSATNEAEATKEAKETKATEEAKAEGPATNEAEATKEAKETKETKETGATT